MIRVLSFGAGVQSITIARMSLDGELPPLDHIIFADTGAEDVETYEHAEMIERACHNRGIGYHTVTCHYERSTGSLWDDLEGSGKASSWGAPPVFLKQPDGSIGISQRQCTGDYKIDPIIRQLREIAGIKPRSPGPREPVVETWIGISSDEKQRMKAPRYRWETTWHPLIEGVPMWRADCYQWLARNGYPIPPKSACVFCPYQSDRRWLRLYDKHPKVFARIVELELHLQEVGVNTWEGTPYFHRSCRPIGQVARELAVSRDRSPELDFEMFNDECGGVCGV